MRLLSDAIQSPRIIFLFPIDDAQSRGGQSERHDVCDVHDDDNVHSDAVTANYADATAPGAPRGRGRQWPSGILHRLQVVADDQRW